MQGKRRRVRNALLSLVLFSGALLLSLLVAEGLVRLVRPQQLVDHRPDVYQPMDTVGFAHRPDVRTTINTGERTVDLFTDRDGYRVGADGRIEAETRILMLGDSFLQALQVDFEQSVAGLLQARLPAILGEPVAVRNAAVSDWQPSQYALQAERSLAREDLDLVLVGVFVSNDVVHKRVESFEPRPYSPVHRLRFPRGLSPKELRAAVLVPLSDYLGARSHLFALTKNGSKSMRIRLGLSRARVPKVLLKDFADAPDWAVSADICLRIANVASARGARTVVVLIPSAEQVDRSRYDAFVRAFDVDTSRIDLDQPNRVLAAELEARGLQVVDLLPVLREVQAEGGDLYGRVDWHFSPSGNEAVAAHLLPIVAGSLGTPQMRQEARPRFSR